ncbi:MAG: hypothetical protein NT062_00760 [Proteobacteria bacterium]|nr:hypothetical protein [Pseudomonadota bacterium]
MTMTTLSATLAALLIATPAFAQPAEDGVDPSSPAPIVAKNRVNLRIGGASTDETSRPTVCVDVSIVLGFAVESCGTGQGLWHHDEGTEMAHFRATYAFLERATAQGTGRLRGGLGFAELQVGVDQLGFHFGSPDPADRGSVAGPEASLQGQWLVPLGKGVEAIASLTAGVAMFSKANELVIPKSNVQPFVSVEVGVGW